MRSGIVRVLMVWGSLALSCGLTSAQPATEDVEVDPLACWWRTTAGEVRAGEPFTLVLTCAVVETVSTKVVPDQSRLDASVVQLEPFEVLGGKRAEDVRTVGQRFIQYEYSVRLLAEAGFGRDVAVPPLSVSYRIETRTGQGASSQGREQTYELPPLPIRIASLVPNESTDIREAAPPTLAEIESRAFRASSLRVGALVAFALGGLVLVAGIVRAARGGRVRTTTRRTLDEAAILRGAGQTLADVQRQRPGDWTPDLTNRALAALRVVASIATGRAVSQRMLERGEPAAEGEIVVRRRLSGARTAVSGSASAVSLSRAQLNGNQSSALADVGDGLARLTEARYGRESVPDPDVDSALDNGIRLARRLVADRGWLATSQARVLRSLERLRPGAWAS